MLGHRQTADLGLGCAFLQELVITVAGLFVAILNPIARGIKNIRQLL